MFTLLNVLIGWLAGMMLLILCSSVFFGIVIPLFRCCCCVIANVCGCSFGVVLGSFFSYLVVGLMFVVSLLCSFNACCRLSMLVGGLLAGWLTFLSCVCIGVLLCYFHVHVISELEAREQRARTFPVDSHWFIE